VYQVVAWTAKWLNLCSSGSRFRIWYQRLSAPDVMGMSWRPEKTPAYPNAAAFLKAIPLINRRAFLAAVGAAATAAINSHRLLAAASGSSLIR
jgi:hypothetical protein